MLVIPDPPEKDELDSEEAAEQEGTQEASAEEGAAVAEEGAGEPPAAVAAPPDDRSAELEAQLEAEREQRIRLEERERLRAEQAPPKEERPKEFSRAQLRSAVEEGKIDEDQMEEIWAKQQREAIVRETEERFERRERERSTKTFVETQTAKYVENFPDVKKVGSPTWSRVKEEYDFLINTGEKDSKATELKALRAALGNADKIAERTSSYRQTSSETTSPQTGGTARPVDIWNQVPKSRKAHYKRMVEEGYMTLEDVKKDIPYMSTTN